MKVPRSKLEVCPQGAWHDYSSIWVRKMSPIFIPKLGFPGDSDGKESAYNVGDLGLIPGLGRPLEKELATYSSILAWRIPWTEGPGGLESMGS